MHTTNSNSKELSECDSKCSVSKGGNSKGFLRGETPFRIHSWKINTFQQQLGKGHPRSVGVSHNSGLQARTPKGTCTAQIPKRDNFLFRRAEPHSRRDQKVASKGSD